MVNSACEDMQSKYAIEQYFQLITTSDRHVISAKIKDDCLIDINSILAKALSEMKLKLCQQSHSSVSSMSQGERGERKLQEEKE